MYLDFFHEKVNFKMSCTGEKFSGLMPTGNMQFEGEKNLVDKLAHTYSCVQIFISAEA